MHVISESDQYTTSHGTSEVHRDPDGPQVRVCGEKVRAAGSVGGTVRRRVTHEGREAWEQGPGPNPDPLMFSAPPVTGSTEGDACVRTGRR
jgi:hypothetical protein